MVYVRNGPPDAVRITFDSRIVHLQALENCRVFRVYRKNRGMIFLCQSIDNLTRYDHGFLIGKGDGLSRTDGIHCRQQNPA